jgi:hypothetical protein
MVVARHFALNLVRSATDKKSIKLRRKIDVGNLLSDLSLSCA